MTRFLLPLTLVFLLSCMSTEQTARKRYSVLNGGIPQDFCSDGETLVIMKKDDGTYNSVFKELVEEIYKGKVRYASENLLQSLNSGTYRYLLDSKTETRTEWYRDNRGFSQSRTYTVYRFFLTDRKRRQDYDPEYYASDYYSLMRAYLLNLEELRQQNAN